MLGTSTVYRVRTKAPRGFSKDLVVKWCRVGEAIPVDTFTLNKFIEAEFNSPYEEFAFALELMRRGFPVVYPRAIYMTGRTSDTPPACARSKPFAPSVTTCPDHRRFPEAQPDDAGAA